MMGNQYFFTCFSLSNYLMSEAKNKVKKGPPGDMGEEDGKTPELVE